MGIRAVKFEKDSVEIKILNDKVSQDTPEDPKEPEQPTDPTTPEDPKEPTKPTDPTTPEDPTKPTKPNNPDKGLSGLLPQTGEQMTIVILIGVAILASVYYFIKMKKERNS